MLMEREQETFVSSTPHLRLVTVDGVRIAPAKQPKRERDAANLTALAAVDPRAIQRSANLLEQIERQGALLHEGVQHVFHALLTKNPDIFTARALARECLLEAAVMAPLANQAGWHLVTPPKPQKRRSGKS